VSSQLTLSIALAALGIALGAAASAGADSIDTLPTADEVIDCYIQALGGREAIDTLHTRVCIGRIIDDLHWATPPYEVTPFVAYAAVPDRVLMVEHKGAGMRCECWDGKTTWVQDATGIILKDEPFRSKIAWLIDPQNAVRMRDYFPDLEVVSEKPLDHGWVYVVESSQLDPVYYALLFDVETGLLVGIGYYWYLQDYREIDGIKVPHRVVMSRKGGSTTFVFDLVDHNLPLDDGLFTLPTQTGEAGN
jgi:hypothetical protein